MTAKGRLLTVVWAVVVGCAGAIVLQGANPEYTPDWVVGDAWHVRVTYKTFRPKKRTIITNEVPAASEMFEHQEQHLTYMYRVKAVDEVYTLKPPLFDPYVARPGRPNVESNQTVATIIEVTAPTNFALLSNWELVFEVTNGVMLEAVERYRDKPPASNPNPYGRDAWLTEFLGELEIIHDFPRIPDASTNETRTVTEVRGEGSFTQSVTFGQDQVTCVMKRWSADHNREHKTTVVWGKGKKWWSSAKVQVGTNVVVSAVLLEGQS